MQDGVQKMVDAHIAQKAANSKVDQAGLVPTAAEILANMQKQLATLNGAKVV